MKSQLYIHLLDSSFGIEKRRCAWRKVSKDGLDNDVQVGDIGTVLEKNYSADQVILALPAEQVVIHSTSILSSKLSKDQDVLRYDIEPSLSLDLDAWHSIELPAQKGRGRAIACIERELLASWCDWLDRSFPEADHAIISEGWLSPGASRKQSDNKVLVTAPGYLCWTCHPRNFSLLDRQLHVELQCYETQEPDELSDTTLLAALAEAPISGRPNLRQAVFKQKRQVSSSPFASAALLICALCLILLIVKTASLNSDTLTTVEALRYKNTETFKAVFSRKTRIVDVKKQLKQEIVRLEQAKADTPQQGEFLPRLAAVTGAIEKSFDDYDLRQIKYDRAKDALTLSLLANSFESLQTLTSAMERPGQSTKLKMVRETDDGYEAVVEVLRL